MSFKKWAHAVQFDRGEPARAAVRKSCRISFHTGMQHVYNNTSINDLIDKRTDGATEHGTELPFYHIKHEINR